MKTFEDIIKEESQNFDSQIINLEERIKENRKRQAEVDQIKDWLENLKFAGSQLLDIEDLRKRRW